MIPLLVMVAGASVLGLWGLVPLLVYLLYYRFSRHGWRWCLLCGQSTATWIARINGRYIGPHCEDCAQFRIFKLSQTGGLRR